MKSDVKLVSNMRTWFGLDLVLRASSEELHKKFLNFLGNYIFLYQFLVKLQAVLV